MYKIRKTNFDVGAGIVPARKIKKSNNKGETNVKRKTN